MKRALVLAFVLVLARTSRADPPPAAVLLDGFDVVGGLRFADVDGDGIVDLMLSAGRTVKVFRGTKTGIGALPTWTEDFAPPAALVWPAGKRGGDGEPAWSVSETPAGRIAQSVVMTEWTHGADAFEPAGRYVWVHDGKRVELNAPLRRKVTPAGPFLEDSTVVQTEWPTPFFVPAWVRAAGKSAVFLLGDDVLRAFLRDGTSIEWSTEFLPPVGEGRALLVDFDGDGTPDVVHEQTSNDSGVYTFFKTTPPNLEGAKAGQTLQGPDLRPARGQVRLAGFQIPADYVDLDGDGRKDFVVTTIEIDGKNVMAAVMQHRVTARTRAFLNRSKSGDAFFQGIPDAEVESYISVKVLFTASGSIEVKRSYTILATADLDGDGKKDLVIRTGPETLSVRRGVEKGVWASEPYTIAIPPVGDSPDVEGYAADLTGDGKDDLVLLYRAPPGGKDRVVVIVSP